MPKHVSAFDAAVREHDQALANAGMEIWIGAEPTFTLRTSESPEWLNEALGETKQAYARRILERLHLAYPGSLVLRTTGRQYRREERPRWSLGLYRRRDGAALADSLPADPLNTSTSCQEQLVEEFWRNLKTVLDEHGWFGDGFRTEGSLPLRLLFRLDGMQQQADPHQDPRLARPSLHEHAIPLEGAVDELAREGLYLLSVGCLAMPGGESVPCIELPAMPDVEHFLELIQLVSKAAAMGNLMHLVWQGYPPPVDRTVAWTTLTPDPAVVEINAAPAADVRTFLDAGRVLYEAAESEDLSAYRLHYNGDLSESGGGGQFTLGGPTPEQSPFFEHPQLLPRMIRYFIRHPALSYWFAPSYVGSFSQSPRPDENVRESFSELSVALQHLSCTTGPQPEHIWRSLSPFLVDTSGNAHRSELNIEKLWNPYLPGRGCLGLVECRAFRMPPNAEHAASIAALLRAITAMLIRVDAVPELANWGSELHDRFALPFYLCRDLELVLADLAAAGFGLGKPIENHLLDNRPQHIGHTEIAGVRLEVDHAIEFWPLLGDAASQEGGSSRLVDASTTRIQLSLRPLDNDPGRLSDWRLYANGYRLPLRTEQDGNGTMGIAGLRYRSFEPWIGLHPGIGKQSPVELALIPPEGNSEALRITLHEWQPQNEAYDGLPANHQEAARRRKERFVVEQLPVDSIPLSREPPAEALTAYCLDLRRCS